MPCHQINLFQMLCLMAHRFTLLMEMLPFLNRTMAFFCESALAVLKKTTKGIHRSLERAHCSMTDRPYDPDGTIYRQWRQQVGSQASFFKRLLSMATEVYARRTGVHHRPPLLLPRGPL